VVKEFRGPAISKAMDEAQRLGLNETVAAAGAPALAKTPVKTGTAQGSIRFEPAQRIGSMWIASFGSYNVIYFIWLEIGARGRPGIRMLQMAADEHFPTLRRRIQAHAKRLGAI
jgi:hypothetical protein